MFGYDIEARVIPISEDYMLACSLACHLPSIAHPHHKNFHLDASGLESATEATSVAESAYGLTRQKDELTTPLTAAQRIWELPGFPG